VADAPINIVRCDRTFSDEILAIFNDAILHSTALYEYEPRTQDRMRAWFDVKEQGKFPVFGALSEDRRLMGFSSYGVFRAFPAYKYTVEHSVYVAGPFRGRGVGKRLLEEVISEAERQGYHSLVGAIDANNSASIALHRRLGFQHAGRLPQVGFKFGQWLDLDFYQLVLATPSAPVDG
jgi:phosphinothricin acetyltransferase